MIRYGPHKLKSGERMREGDGTYYRVLSYDIADLERRAKLRAKLRPAQESAEQDAEESA